MKIQKTEAGLYLPSCQRPIKEVKHVHDKLGLQIWTHAEYIEKTILDRKDNGEAIKDRYVLVNVYNLQGMGLCNGFHVYPGKGKTWGGWNACIMTKERAEDRLEYYKEHGFCEYT